mmetsp:Transcript_8352/g.10324  ORF Transcript_8352/g.10324 Transcript_8352/m.10324 type:complete len:111 (+) Transcript_8352:693-1025(+)
MYAQEQFHSLGSDTKNIPSASTSEFPPGSEGQQLLRDLQSVATAEYLVTKRAPEDLKNVKNTEGRYKELLSTLQQTSLHKHDTSAANLADLNRKRSGTSTFNTIRKCLKM